MISAGNYTKSFFTTGIYKFLKLCYNKEKVFAAGSKIMLYYTILYII